MTPLQVGDRVRETKTGLVGTVAHLYDVGIQGILAVIKLDEEHPIYGSIISAFVGEIEIEGQRPDQDIESNPGHFAEKALATRVGTTTRAGE